MGIRLEGGSWETFESAALRGGNSVIGTSSVEAQHTRRWMSLAQFCSNMCHSIIDFYLQSWSFLHGSHA